MSISSACQSDKPEVVEVLLEGGANPTARNQITGWVPLHEAAWKGHRSCCEKLLERRGKCRGYFGVWYKPFVHLKVQIYSRLDILFSKKSGATSKSGKLKMQETQNPENPKSGTTYKYLIYGQYHPKLGTCSRREKKMHHTLTCLLRSR